MSTAASTIAPALSIWGREEISPTEEHVRPSSEDLSQFRFTLDGSDTLERHLSEVCHRVADGICAIVPSGQLEGILLAGGYGRGEGGVLRTAGDDRPYNDMEFYVFIRGSTLTNDRRYKQALHELGERLSPQAGLEVEFKILSLAGLRRSKPTMFSYDFVSRHHWVVGDDSLLAGCGHHRDARSIPASEATRLLFNRSTGLLFSALRLLKSDFSAEDADFVGRNIAKAQLGIGDALLASEGQYHPSCLKRHGRLCSILREASDLGSTFPTLLAEHEAGVLFKLRPQRSALSQAELVEKHREISALAMKAWLHLESGRLQCHFSDAADYAASPFTKCPEQPAWRNILVNLRTFGPSVLKTSLAARYPRERLFNALSALLWTDWDNPQTTNQLRQSLNTDAANLGGFVSAYEKLWHRFN